MQTGDVNCRREADQEGSKEALSPRECCFQRHRAGSSASCFPGNHALNPGSALHFKDKAVSEAWREKKTNRVMNKSNHAA